MLPEVFCSDVFAFIARSFGLRLLVADVVIVTYVLAGKHIAVSKVVLFVGCGGGGSQARPKVLADRRLLAVPGWRPRASLGGVVKRDRRSSPVCLAGERGGVLAPTVVGLAFGWLAWLRPCVGVKRPLCVSRGEAIVWDEVAQVLSCALRNSLGAVDPNVGGVL